MAASQPLRVLFLIDSFRMGGAERITVALLPHLDRSRVTPLVCTLHRRRESPLVEHVGDVPRFDLAARRLLDPFALRRLLRLLNDQQVDLIHAQLQDATIFAAAAHRQTRIPVVVTRHLIEDDTDNWRRRMRNRLERFTIRHGVDRIITVSDAAQEAYAAVVRVPRARFQTIYNGIDLDRFSSGGDKPALRQALNLPAEGPLVTMVGVMRPGKGQEVAIEAARALPGIHLLLVGDGRPPYRTDLEARAEGLEDRVHFLGQRMDVPDLLRASDMLILPSDNEALPTVLIEAGASALPVVATCVGGIPEIVEDGTTGILIPPQDPAALAGAIQRLVDDPVLAQAMGQRAYERVRSVFTLPNQAEQTTALYEAVVAEAGQKAS
jgi:glycosyltransferase involved in cell wall biosynthesis